MSGMHILLRVLAVLLAAALLALGVVVTVEIALAALGRPPWVLPHPQATAALRDNTWASGLARAVGAALCALGLLLLLPALRPGPPTALPLTPLTDGVETQVSRRGLQQTLRDAAGRVDGVRRARAKVNRRTVKIRASSSLRDPGDLPQQIEQRVHAALDELSLRRPLNVKVSTDRRR